MSPVGRSIFLFGCCSLSLLSGCGKSGPEVSGVVTWAGQPLPGVRLVFEPLDPAASGGGTLAVTNEAGLFTIEPHPTTGETLNLGMYAVNVSRKVDVQGNVPPQNDYPQFEAAGQLRESLPPKYVIQPGTPPAITALIKEGRNDLTFHLMPE